MKNIIESVIKFVESVDPEEQVISKEQKEQFKASAEDQINKLQAEQEQQVKAEAEQQIKQAEEQKQELECQLKQSQEECEQLKADVEEQKKIFEQKIKDIIAQNTQQMDVLQKSLISSTAKQIAQAKQEQSAEDEAVAIEQTQQLISDIEAKQKEQQEQLIQNISDFIDTVVNGNTQLQAKLNQQAQIDAQAKVLNQIKKALFDDAVMTQEVQQKQQEIIDDAQKNANDQIEKNVELNKENSELKAENEELKEEISKLRAEKIVDEKLSESTLRPRTIRMIKESMEGKTEEEVEDEIDDAIKDAERDEDKFLSQRRKAIAQNKQVVKTDIEDENKKQQKTQPITESGNSLTRAIARTMFR